MGDPKKSRAPDRRRGANGAGQAAHNGFWACCSLSHIHDAARPKTKNGHALERGGVARKICGGRRSATTFPSTAGILRVWCGRRLWDWPTATRRPAREVSQPVCRTRIAQCAAFKGGDWQQEDQKNGRIRGDAAQSLYWERMRAHILDRTGATLAACGLVVFEAGQIHNRTADLFRVVLFTDGRRRFRTCRYARMDHGARSTVETEEWVVVVVCHCDLLTSRRPASGRRL